MTYTMEFAFEDSNDEIRADGTSIMNVVRSAKCPILEKTLLQCVLGSGKTLDVVSIRKLLI